MKRDLYQALLRWKQSTRRKPLVLQGARQVGKTYLLKQFGQTEYTHSLYLNFEEERKLSQYFKNSLNPHTIIQELSVFKQIPIQPEHTLLIFDEIQECPEALNSLKYFREKANEYHIVAAGSLLGVKLSRTHGFPVGQVNFLMLYPMTFMEFLSALGKTEWREFLESFTANGSIPEPLHFELIQLLRRYFYVGGLPEAVEVYRNTQDLPAVREVHREVLQSYHLDFAKHAEPHEIMKITRIWDQVPSQLAKENKKFIFTAIKKSARAREYEAALQWLADAGLIIRSFHISAPRIPLEGYCDKNIFKVYCLDVGLLASLCQIAPEAMFEEHALFTEYKGALTENFVAQALVATHHSSSLYYWSSPGTAEVDFVMQKDSQTYPLEVKAGTSQHKRSLLVYAEKYHPIVLSRTSLRSFVQEEKIVNYPLYMVGRFPIEIPDL